jgi:hypothetical protein
MTHFQFEPLQLQLETFLLIQFVLPESKHRRIPTSISVSVKITNFETDINKNYEFTLKAAWAAWAAWLAPA